MAEYDSKDTDQTKTGRECTLRRRLRRHQLLDRGANELAVRARRADRERRVALLRLEHALSCPQVRQRLRVDQIAPAHRVHAANAEVGRPRVLRVVRARRRAEQRVARVDLRVGDRVGERTDDRRDVGLQLQHHRLLRIPALFESRDRVVRGVQHREPDTVRQYVVSARHTLFVRAACSSSTNHRQRWNALMNDQK